MELLTELIQMSDALKSAKPHVNAIAKMLFKQSADWVKDPKRSKEAKYYGVVHTESTLVDHRGKPLRLTFDNSTDSGEFEINSLAPLAIKKGSDLDVKIKKMYKDFEIDSSKKTNYIVRHGDSVLREIHLGKFPSQNTVDFVREVLSLLKKPTEITESEDQTAKLKSLLKTALEELQHFEDMARYENEEDEVGERICCGEVSYRPHSPRCTLVKAISEIKKAL